MKKILGIVVLGLLLSTNVFAAKFKYSVGDIVENEVVLGKKDKFPLPPGKFTVAVIKKSRGISNMMLYQEDKNGITRWNIHVYGSGRTEWEWWNPGRFCERTNVYFIKKKLGNKKFACWMVNHTRSDIGSNKGFWKLVRDHAIANQVKSPDIFVYSQHEYANRSKLYGIGYYYNPELDGVPKPKSLEWDTNEFHLQRVMNYPKHEAFLKKYISVTASLVDRFNKLNNVKGGLTLSPEENFSQASISVEKTETKKIKKSADTDKGDLVSELKELKDLLDSGALTKEEFEKAKKKLLN